MRHRALHASYPSRHGALVSHCPHSRALRYSRASARAKGLPASAGQGGWLGKQSSARIGGRGRVTAHLKSSRVLTTLAAAALISSMSANSDLYEAAVAHPYGTHPRARKHARKRARTGPHSTCEGSFRVPIDQRRCAASVGSGHRTGIPAPPHALMVSAHVRKGAQRTRRCLRG
jgi:hypothetical protein